MLLLSARGGADRQDRKEIASVIIELCAYAFVNAAAVVSVLKPAGRVQIAVCSGVVCVEYGGSAVLAAGIVSAAMGAAVLYVKKNRQAGIRKSVCVLWCTAVIVLFGFHLMQGFRWPSDYVLTNHMISYRFGWVPRSLIGAAGVFVFGDRWYLRRYMDAVIIGAAAVFLIWFIFEFINYACRIQNIIAAAVFLSFAISPYAKYYLHEMGYYEQYGYAACALLLYPLQKASIKKNIVISAAAGFIILLVSESNVFLVLPILAADTFICIVNDSAGHQMKKNLGAFFLSYVPHVLYCACVWMIKVPKGLVDQMAAYDKSHAADFVFRSDVHYYMCGDRSNAGIWGRQLHAVPVWCAVYPLVLIAFTALVIYWEKNMRLLVSYVFSAIAAGTCAYLIVILAWDLDRYCFCIFMSVFLVTAFALRKYLYRLKVEKKYAYASLLLVCLLLPMCRFRLGLFDGARYNESIQDFLKTAVSGR